MKKLSLMLCILFSGLAQCASNSDAEQAEKEEQQYALQRMMELARPNFDRVAESRELILESVQLPGGRLSIKTSNLGIELFVKSPSLENGYALSQWRTTRGKLGALALCARSELTEMPMPILSYACCAFVKLCSEKIKVSPAAETCEGLQTEVHNAAEELKAVPLGSGLFVSGLLVQSDKLYTFIANDSFSAINVGSGRSIPELRTKFSIGNLPFITSWDPS